jgi:cytochrome c oxidase subunit 4
MSQVERAGSPEHDLHDHPGPRKYVFIAVVLAIVTAIEVAIYYVDLPEWGLVVGLISFGIIKFWLVAQWFMHLKFDSKLFKAVFFVGVIGAIILFLIAMGTLFNVGGPAPDITRG